MKKPPARALAIVEPDETPSLQGVIDAALRIAESRAGKERRMREAILAGDLETTLAMACELAGFSGQDAAQRVERLLSPVAKTGT